MTVRIWLHSVLAGRTAGEAERTVAGEFATVRAALESCFSEEPRVLSGMIDEQGVLRPHIAIFIDGERVSGAGALDAILTGDCEIGCFCAVSGG